MDDYQNGEHLVIKIEPNNFPPSDASGGGGLHDSWDRFIQFEDLSFDASVGTSLQFLAEFESRLNRALASGCIYSETHIAFKLLQKSGLDEARLRQFLSEQDSRKDIYRLAKCFFAGQWVEEDGGDEEEKTLITTKSDRRGSEANVKTETATEMGEVGFRDGEYMETSYGEAEEDGVEVIAGGEEKEVKQRRGRSHRGTRKTSALNRRRAGVRDRNLPINPCDMCDYVAHKKSLLQQHKMAVHAQPTIFICSLCPFTAPTKKMVDRHKNSTHEKHSCDLCEFVGATEFKLLQHKKVDHGIAKFRCEVCDHLSTTRSDLKRHMLDKHDVGGVRHICDECGYTAKHLSNIKMHKENVHQDIRRAPCPHCSYIARGQPHLKQHIQRMHEGVKYPCEKCEYKATSTSALRLHNQMYHEGVRYHCDQCDHVAIKKQRLKLHIQNKHEGVRYPCDQCDLLAVNPGILKRHKESVHDGIKYLCDQCDYSATQKSQLTKHQRTKHKLVMEGGVGGGVVVGSMVVGGMVVGVGQQTM